MISIVLFLSLPSTSRIALNSLFHWALICDKSHKEARPLLLLFGKAARMETLTLELPAMYGDHHVTEVRRLLMALAGVVKVYASSSFHLVEIDFDSSQTTSDQITACLDESGYLGDLMIPVEIGVEGTRQGNGNGNKILFRHTSATEEASRTVRFSQTLPSAGRPLWPCPGLGTITSQHLEE
jgi:copper chaperone CopZ